MKTSKEKFQIRETITGTSSKNLEIMYNNSVTDEWTKGIIAQELIERKIFNINADIKAKQIYKLDQIFGCAEEEGEVE